MVAVPQLPFEQAHPLEFAPRLRELQAKGVVHRVRTPAGDPAWLVTGHAEVLRLYDDNRLGVAPPEPDKAARMYASDRPMPNFATEHADHARKRALLQPHFTPKNLQAMRPRVDALTTQLLDHLAAKGSPADLRAAVAVPLPALVICELLGVPCEDSERFCAWITDVSARQDPARTEHGLGQLFTYSQQLVARKRREPGDDVISRLCATEGVSDDEAARLATGLLWAGHGSPAPHIGLGVLLLLANPEQWRALARDPTLASCAVEETLRAARSSVIFPRYARTDLEITGVTIQAGDLVLMSIGAANYDPSVFAAPERVDISRRALGHLTFGHGGRYCIAAPLARIELHAVLSQLASRFPAMQLAVGVEELTLRTHGPFGGLVELPVQW
ncbi:MAG: cytochrome P450 [Mycobacterium sp.]|uniref:cytochrome P450 n=1 Tax=Mycobacterium sp. TaxID=1785 RepID=UPI003C4DD3AB